MSDFKTWKICNLWWVVICGNINFRFSTSNLSSGSLLQFFTLISNMGVAPRSTYPFGRADTTPPSPSTHFRQQNRANSSSKCSCDHLVLRSQNVLQNYLQKSLPPPTRVRSPVEAVFTFLCFTAKLQIFTLFYFGVVYFTIQFERKKKKEGSNYGQIFPKIVHQKINSVFEMQYSFSQTLNAIQTNIKESKVFKRINLRLRWK